MGKGVLIMLTMVYMAITDLKRHCQRLNTIVEAMEDQLRLPVFISLHLVVQAD